MKVHYHQQRLNKGDLPVARSVTQRIFCLLLFSCLTANALLPTAALAGNAAPALQLRGKDAGTQLSDFKAKLVYLDFWATWCAPCRYSFPWMEKMQEKYRDAGLVIVAVSVDGERKSIDHFLQDQKVSFKVLQDKHMHTANAYGVDAMPSTFLIGEDGKILYHHRGFNGADKNKLEQKIRDILLK